MVILCNPLFRVTNNKVIIVWSPDLTQISPKQKGLHTPGPWSHHFIGRTDFCPCPNSWIPLTCSLFLYLFSFQDAMEVESSSIWPFEIIFPTQHLSLEIHLSTWVSRYLIPSCCGVIPQWGYFSFVPHWRTLKLLLIFLNHIFSHQLFIFINSNLTTIKVLFLSTMCHSAIPVTGKKEGPAEVRGQSSL